MACLERQRPTKSRVKNDLSAEHQPRENRVVDHLFVCHYLNKDGVDCEYKGVEGSEVNGNIPVY